MSANNCVHIEKMSKGYFVSDVDVEDMGKGLPVGEFDTLEEAIIAANKYISENEVEYGLDINI